jgi:MFS family permease
MPCVFLSCFILCIAQSSVAWYLPSLQPFLESTFSLSTLATGAMFTVEGATYAAFSPMWGWLLDRCIYCNPNNRYFTIIFLYAFAYETV